MSFRLTKTMYVPCCQGKPIGLAENALWDAWRTCYLASGLWKTNKHQLRKLGYSIKRFKLVEVK